MAGETLNKFSAKLSPDDAYKFVACNTHIGTNSVDFQSDEYTFKRRSDGIYLINLGYTWQKLTFAARAIAAVANPAEVCVVSSRQYVQRALLKFAAHTGAVPFVGRFIPGSFTNQIQKNFKEPRLIIVSDPRADHQAIREASYVNIPVIAFTNTDSPLKFVDIAIPGNNKGTQSTGLLWWMLCREVLRLRGSIKVIDKTHFMLGDKKVMPDLYFYRDIEEQKREDEEKKAKEKEAKEKEKEEAAEYEVPEYRHRQYIEHEPELEPEPEPVQQGQFHFEDIVVGNWAAYQNPDIADEQQTEVQQPAGHQQQNTQPAVDDEW